MTKGKFKYNSETLEFENTERSKKQKLLINLLSIFVGSILIAVVIFFVFVLFFDINIKKQKASDYKILQEQYEKLLERKKQNDAYLQELIKKDKIIYQSVFKNVPDNSVFEQKNPYTRFTNTDVKILIENNTERLKKLKKVSENQTEKLKRFVKLSEKYKKEDLRRIPLIQPIVNYNLQYPVYGFGERIDQVYKSLVFHPGFDFAVPEGTAVYATADGKVEKAGRKRGLGKRIVIDHQNGYKTVYAHLDFISVKNGNTVKKGQKIGTVGMTGKTLISHLHYEIIFNEKSLNPVNFFIADLNPDTYMQIIQKSEKSGLSLD